MVSPCGGRVVFAGPFRSFGLLMIVAGLTYWINNFGLFLALPIPYIPWVTLIAELSLALWLLVVGVNEAKWRAQLATR